MLNKDAEDILIGTGNVIEGLSDGLGWEDLGLAIDVSKAVDGWKEGVASIKEARATEEGRQEINQVFRDNFDIPNDKFEARVEYYQRAVFFIWEGIELHQS